MYNVFYLFNLIYVYNRIYSCLKFKILFNKMIVENRENE